MPRTRSTPPAGPAGVRGKEAPEAEGDDEAQIRVRCPNPACETVYTVPARYAGKPARCTECGARALIPTPTTATPTTAVRTRPRDEPSPAKSTRRGREEAPPPAKAEFPEVRIGSIGRGHAGKTALFHALDDSLVGDYLTSGLHLDAAD